LNHLSKSTISVGSRDDLKSQRHAPTVVAIVFEARIFVEVGHACAAIRVQQGRELTAAAPVHGAVEWEIVNHAFHH